MSGDDDKLRVEFQLPASWQREIADAWRAVSGPAVGALGALQQRTFLWQLNNAAKILQRAKSLADEHGLKLNPVPPKFLIPFLEKAGLELEDDSGLRDSWARLLVSESIETNSLNRVFIEILSSIGPSEAKLIDQLASAYPREGSGEILFNAAAEDIVKDVMGQIFSKLTNEYLQEFPTLNPQEVFKRLSEMRGPNHAFKGFPTILCFPTKNHEEALVGAITVPNVEMALLSDSISVLLNLGVLQKNIIYANIAINLYRYRLEWVELSELGMAFFNACSIIPNRDLRMARS